MGTPRTTESIGGYDYDFVDTPHDRYVCKICHLPSREPYMSECCGHLFCKSCLDNVKKASAITISCPVCRDRLFKTFCNKGIDREVRELRVYCTNKDKGCAWLGELNHINNHLEKSDGCLFEMIQCDYYSVGCKRVKLARKDQEEHRKQKIEEHLMMMKSELTNTKAQLDETKAQLDAALKQINSLAVLVKPHLFPVSDTDNRFIYLDALATMFKFVCPVTIKVVDFTKKKESDQEWYSEPFYTHNKGYKVCLCVCACGDGDGKGTHLSSFLYLMKGHHDDELKWPFRGRFKVKLLNQISDGEHDSGVLVYDDSTPQCYTSRLIENERAIHGWGFSKFVSHEQLYKATPTRQYLKDDYIFFQVNKL